MTITFRLKHNNRIVTLDDEDADLLTARWWMIPNGYIVGMYHEQVVYMHRVIMARIIGSHIEKGKDVDHIDRNRANNTRCNLRLVSRSQNLQNRTLSKRSNSGHKWITYDKTCSRKIWKVEMCIENRKKTIGRFETIEEAVLARNAYLHELGISIERASYD